MNVYDKWILPRLTDLAMRNKEATRYRSQIVPQACGPVLEIGVGSGLKRKITGGCNLNRQMGELIQASGFRIVQLDVAYAKGLRPMSYIYSGRAQPDDLRKHIER